MALLLAGYPLRQLVLPVGELASLQAGGIRTASTAAAAGTAQHGRGSLAPARQIAGPTVQKSAEGWPEKHQPDAALCAIVGWHSPDLGMPKTIGSGWQQPTS